ncbi:hypothetical protein JD844_027391 [Phrynosoma platyrhinos]|uniref:Fibroblast growth factor n=1 Tax=Phrynosoma platyrhinos TaxID=52577 RepID=A0ABQ7SGF1_PHRPL|nr:hypothetical protein JD844_027391 [Phrynosoma platyrhinos]
MGQCIFLKLMLFAVYGWKAVAAFPNSSPLLNFNWRNSDSMVHLYTSTERNSFHLQINSDGHVNGSPDQTIYSKYHGKCFRKNMKKAESEILEMPAGLTSFTGALIIKSQDTGYVVIKGVESERFLCMDVNGNLFGSHHFSYDACTFKQLVLENGYDVYQSPKYNYLVSLGKVKQPFIPNMNPPPYSQFLTRRNEIPLIQFNRPDTDRNIDDSSNDEDPNDEDPNNITVERRPFSPKVSF